jgi:hypothetical protein
MRIFGLFLSALVFIFPLQLFGNGGVFSLSAVHRTGNLEPLQKEAISLVKETINIRVEEDDALVHVSYELHNRGGSDAVTFGFPVDVAVPETIPTPNGYEWVLSQSLRDFRVVDGTESVAVDRIIDKPLSAADWPPGLDPEIRLTRRWSIMTLKFKPDERKHVIVSYKVRALARDYGFSERDLDWKFGLRTLFYTFRPASTWGNGRVGELVVTLDTRWLMEREVPLTKIAPVAVSNEQGLMRWVFHDKDLAKIGDLTFSYDPSGFYLDRLLKENLLPPKRIKSLEVSSSLKSQGRTSYGKEAMFDRDLRSAWVEGASGPGIGESITLQPQAAYIERVGLLNGYLADESLYYANARVKKVRVELELGENAEPNEKKQVYEVTLPDRSYKTLNQRYLFPSIDWVVQHGQGNGFINKVKLTILEVYPGRQYEDTAITEFYIGGFPVPLE